ncbi:Proline-rich family protein [Zostera marina]|uniref:Proline-rich family protein n=1 Tax=Zostera marina TaxID=29655 RepID=A0A0K9PWL8_ZOSMR|nr:Proline-rich family protein [Zostera marina]
MAAASHSMLSATPHSHIFLGSTRSPDLSRRRNVRIFSSSDQEDCNDLECAPDKEVGKISMEWVASEKTQVVGTYPPKRKGWTGYVEKDTAGQTNIYAVEPVVYVSESSISSGEGGTSAEGTQNTAAVTAGIGLIAIAAASSILLQVGKNEAQAPIKDYNGPPLNYFIGKFKPASVLVADAPVAPSSGDLQEAPSVEST